VLLAWGAIVARKTSKRRGVGLEFSTIGIPPENPARLATEERQSEGRVRLGDINYTAYNRAANVDSFSIEVFPAQSRDSNISSMGDLKL
jgi:hypothetical protein